jgi:pilus assembly protein CpaC
MYDNPIARPRTARRIVQLTAVASAIIISLGAVPSRLRAQDFGSPSVIRKISELSEKLELTTNTSRILTLDKPIPRVQVNNPELLVVTPLSATQVQIAAKKAGVTQVNLWDEEGNIHTVDVLIYGDARELQVALQTQFPHSSIKVYRYSESLVLNGFVDRPDHVGPIMRLAEDYAPKVINNISVGGVQQILLRVKVMEISRTKARTLGIDWAFAGNGGDFAFSSVNEIIERDAPNFFFDNNQETFSFGIVGTDAFFATLDALQEARVAKILAEPNLVAVSGRPAQFNVGGEIPILVPQSLGTTAIEYKPFGTQIDFLPIVLGNGNIRLEVRPRVSEIDESRSVQIDTFNIPGLTVRQVDTAVEMKAGQTFALAGLVQERVNTVNRGLPYLADVPVLGVPFRRTEDEVNEVELLILVTPEFVDAMEPHQVPCGGPGYATTSPTTRQLYCGGHVEVPAHCNPISGMTACGEQAHGYGCSNCPPGGGYNSCGPGGPNGAHPHMITDGVVPSDGIGPDAMPAPSGEVIPDSPDLPLPNGTEPSAAPVGPGVHYTPGGTSYSTAGAAQYTSPRPYSPTRQPVFVRNTTNPTNPQQPGVRPASVPGQSGLIGPVGYDPQ